MLTFGRHSSRDVLNSLNNKSADFEKDPLNSDIAIQCAIDAWSLCDWIFKEHGARLGFQTLRDFQSTMKTMCPHLALFQDIANASKHKTITTYQPCLKEAKNHGGAFQRDAFSSGFDVSALVLVKEDYSEIWFDDVLKDVIQHWNNYFAQHGL